VERVDEQEEAAQDGRAIDERLDRVPDHDKEDQQALGVVDERVARGFRVGPHH